MFRKLTIATSVLLITAAIALSGTLKPESRVVETITAVPPAVSLCGGEFVKNVQIRNLGGNDFEVSWGYEPLQGCQPDGFEVVITVKRRVGNGILGQKTIKAGPGERVAIFRFGSVFGIDQVTATVTGTITLKSVAPAALNL